MIHSAYFHGDERPATGLALRQLRAARRDPAGVLWVDLADAAPDEVDRVVDALGARPSWRTLREPGATHRDGTLDLATLDLWLDGSLVATRHAGQSPALRRLAERLEPQGGALAGGAPALVAALGESLADVYAAAVAPAAMPRGADAIAQRTAAVTRAADEAARALEALATGLAPSAPARAALDAATARLAALARGAAADAGAAREAASAAELVAAVAAATRQLRLTGFIMLAATGILAYAAFVLTRLVTVVDALRGVLPGAP